MVNLVERCNEGGWKTPYIAWLNMEATEDGEVYFLNVALGGDKDKPRSREGIDCITTEEEYELWLG
jgi:hypothetical protein